MLVMILMHSKGIIKLTKVEWFIFIYDQHIVYRKNKEDESFINDLPNIMLFRSVVVSHI